MQKNIMNSHASGAELVKTTCVKISQRDGRL